MRRPENFFSVSDVARQLNTIPQNVFHHIEAGNIPAPSAVWKQRRYYLPHEVARVVEFWAARVPENCSRYTAEDVRKMRLMWNAGMRQADIADVFGCNQATVSSLLCGRTLPGWRGGASGAGRPKSWKPRRRNNAK